MRKGGCAIRPRAQIDSIELFGQRAEARRRIRAFTDARIQPHLDAQILQHGQIVVDCLLRKTLFAQLAQASGKPVRGLEEVE